MSRLNTVRIRIFRRCARCGAEERPEIIDRQIDPEITYDENSDRITVEALYTTDNNPYAPDEDAIGKIVEKNGNDD